MKKIIALFFIIGIISCEEKDPCEGVNIDNIQQTLLIELVDSSGNNLIENNTYDANTIFVERDGFKRLPCVYTDESFIPDAFKNLIFLTIYGSKDKDNIWSIYLNDQETEILSIDLSIEDVSCSGTFYKILKVTYNGVTYEVEDLENNSYKISIVK